jgi:hypothetical protein
MALQALQFPQPPTLELPQPPTLDIGSIVTCDPKTGLPKLNISLSLDGLTSYVQTQFSNFINSVKSYISSALAQLSPAALLARAAAALDELAGGILRQIRDAIRLARSLISKIPTSLADLAGLVSDLLGLCGRERISGQQQYKELQQLQFQNKQTGQYLSEAASINTGFGNDATTSAGALSPKEKRDTWSVSGALDATEQRLTSAANSNFFSKMTGTNSASTDPNYKTNQSQLQSTGVEFAISPQPLTLRRR